MELPEKRNFGWDLKPFDSAHTEVNILPSGQTELIIDHSFIKGIRADMLVWWFQHFPYLTVTKGGRKYTAYDLWHPYDHVHVGAKKDKRKIEEGDYFIIQECFGRNTAYCVDEKATIFYLKEDGIGFRAYKFGLQTLQLLHKFKDVEGGVHYRSRMVLGVEKGILKSYINNKVIPKKFGPEKAKAWLKHNIEEVGCFEHFLKGIYEKRTDGLHIQWE